MRDGYPIFYTASPLPEESEVLFQGINANAKKKRGMNPITPFGFFVKDATGKVLGGIQGITYYGCLYIDMLWVAEELRSKGIGTQLMQKAEILGKERGATFATVNTMDWEAKSLYEILGYYVEFTREGYLKDSKLYMLRKKLE